MLLLLTAAALAAPPDDRPSAGPPRLTRGDELVYRGEVIEAGDRVTNRFRKRHELEVRVFVLNADRESADCAVMTLLRTPPDPVVAGPAVAVTGAAPPTDAIPPAVHLDLVRVDSRGRVVLLTPPPGPPPIPLGPATDTAPPPPPPSELPSVIELGMFVPLPPKLATVGQTWTTAEPGRPPIVWTAAREDVWNGCRCVRVEATQQTDGWDQPAITVAGWKRTEAILAAPADGYATTVTRKIERREGAALVGWIEVRYELQPPTRHVGVRYDDVRHEVEVAYGYGSEVAALLAKPGSPDPEALRGRLAKLDQFIGDRLREATGFRAATDAVRRRCEAAARTDYVPATVRPVSHAIGSSPPAIGKPAPDFVAPLVHSAGQFRLSAAHDMPVVLVFYKPGIPTAEGALRVAQALHHVFDRRITVAALAVSAQGANAERDALKLNLLVADGSGVRSTYGVEFYPQFLVVDPTGILRWRFVGFGAEVGYLVKQQVEKWVE